MAKKEIDSKQGGFFWTGYTTDLNNTFVTYKSGKQLKTNDKWKYGQNNYRNMKYDCLQYVHNYGLFSTFCSNLGIPVCKVLGHVEFTLDGVCKESFVDSHYVLQPNGVFLGFTNTQLSQNINNKHWEIWNRKNNSIAAYSNHTKEFPLGLHKWYFLDVSCTDINQSWRQLNLHLKVDRPGKFCCDDGACIDSSLACDGDYHCDDDSDEKNCKLVNPNQGYRKDVPPKKKEKNKVSS